MLALIMKAQTVTFVVNASKLIGANDSAIVKERQLALTRRVSTPMVRA